MRTYQQRVIKRITIFVDASLKQTLDGLSVPRPRAVTPCKCGGKQWRECETANPEPGKVSQICRSCGRRRKLSLILVGVVSAVDGTGVVDRLIAAHLRVPFPVPLHVPTVKTKMGIFLHRDLHKVARATAKAQKRSLSALLASVIAAKFAPRQEKAA